VPEANLERETAGLRALHSDPELCTIVPRASAARDSEVQLQLNEFVTGWPYERALPRLTELAWVESMAQILSVARMVSRRATDLLPSLLTTPAPAPLCVAAANALRELGAVGLAADVLQGLERALAGAGAVPPLLQHGDLWPGNVLWHHGSWRLLDFEVFGIVQTPLYDVCHFVRNCWTLREPRVAGHATTAVRSTPRRRGTAVALLGWPIEGRLGVTALHGGTTNGTLDAALDWLIQAHDNTGNGAFPPHYPVIPTLYLAAWHLERPGLAQRAARAAQRAVELQLSSGAVWGGVVGTGRALLGWLSAFAETGSGVFAGAARRAGRFLFATLDHEGVWRRDGAHSPHTAWALAETGRRLGAPELRAAAAKHLRTVARLQHDDGWMPDVRFPGRSRGLADLADAIRALLEGGR